MNKKRMAIIFAAVIFACVLSIGIVTVADESETVANTDVQEQPSYTEAPGEIGYLARRAEKLIQEVNEASGLEKEQLETVKREQYFEDYKEETNRSLLSNDDIAAIENERTQKEKAIRTKVGYEIESLEAQQPASQEVSQPAPAPASRPASQTSGSSRGMVKGIVFCDSKGAALIAGDVVREGDVVLGVKVTQISPDFVAFDKQGNQWKQQVGQTPPPAVWEQPQKSAPAQRPSTDTKTKNKSSK
jgi:hypothetical protein